MPGVIRPAVKVFANMHQVYFTGSVLGLPLPDLAAEAAQAGPAQPAGIWPQVIAQKVQAAPSFMGDRENAGLPVGGQVQVIGKPAL